MTVSTDHREGPHVAAARRLLTQESASNGDATAEERAAAAGRVYERLFQSLAPVIGAAGVRAVFARSVKLSKVAFPCLAEVRLTAEPPTSNANLTQQLVGCLGKLDPATASAVAIGLFATMFALLSNFIGEQLVRQIVRSAFPAAAASDDGDGDGDADGDADGDGDTDEVVAPMTASKETS